jgi:hypothetical protein
MRTRQQPRPTPRRRAWPLGAAIASHPLGRDRGVVRPDGAKVVPKRVIGGAVGGERSDPPAAEEVVAEQPVGQLPRPVLRGRCRSRAGGRRLRRARRPVTCRRRAQKRNGRAPQLLEGSNLPGYVSRRSGGSSSGAPRFRSNRRSRSPSPSRTSRTQAPTTTTAAATERRPRRQGRDP